MLSISVRKYKLHAGDKLLTMVEYSVTSNWTPVQGSVRQALWVRDASAEGSSIVQGGLNSTVLLRRPESGDPCELYGKN